MRRTKLAWTVGLLLAGVLLLASPSSEAGKPGPSQPLVLSGVSPYSETSLFTSDDVLLVAQGAFGNDNDTAYMYRDLKVDAEGAVWSLFTAYDSTNTVYVPQTDLLKKAWNGIVRWDGTDVGIVYSTSWINTVEENATFDPDYWEGESLSAMDVVPELSASATGDLEAGDLVALRWVDDDPSTSVLKDDMVEVVHFRPVYNATTNAFEGLDEEGVLYTFPQPGDFGGDIAVDLLGRIYVRISHTQQNANNGYDLRLWLISYDATTSTYGHSDVRPTTFDMQGHIEVDEDGALYLMGRNWSDDSGVIYRKPIGGSWASYATYLQKCCVEGFHGWTHEAGTFAIALRESLPKSKYFVALVTQGDVVDRADRIADTSIRSVDAMAADAGGSVYVLHTDRTWVDNYYGIDRQTVYRLDLGTDDGGGSPGNGNGKGKNK